MDTVTLRIPVASLNIPISLLGEDDAATELAQLSEM